MKAAILLTDEDGASTLSRVTHDIDTGHLHLHLLLPANAKRTNRGKSIVQEQLRRQRLQG